MISLFTDVPNPYGDYTNKRTPTHVFTINKKAMRTVTLFNIITNFEQKHIMCLKGGIQYVHVPPSSLNIPMGGVEYLP